MSVTFEKNANYRKEIFDRIPAGMATNETWMLRSRKAVPTIQPAAFFRPENFTPVPFGYEQGIPLYRLDQTKAYNPRPETIASQQYYEFFVASQNRHRHSRWDNGKRKYRADVAPTWRTYQSYLSRAKIRDHLRGKDIYGCWGDLWTNWFALDLDYHGGDPDLFLALLEILKELPDFFPDVRWLYVLNRTGISGLHMVGLLPGPTLLDDVRADIQKVLGYLEDENMNRLLKKYKPDGLREEDFHPLANIEFYPATNHNFRLPYAADRITVTDEWLNLPGQVDLKANLLKFMSYVKEKDREAVPLAEVIEYVQANVQVKPEKKKLSMSQKKPASSGGGNGTGMGKIEPLKGRHLKFITGVVLGTEAMPNDTIGSWAAPALRHLMLVDGLDADEALGRIEEFYEMIPDPSFSDRLASGNIRELLRTDAYTADKIEEGNLYQSQPEESTEKFARVKARCKQIGFVFADPSTWHVLENRRASCQVLDISEMDFSLTFSDKLAIKEPGGALLKCDVRSLYQAAHCIKAFVTKYPFKELPATLVPALCSALPISWYVPSDNGTRCKKAERFLALLCSMGIIKLVEPSRWYGHGHSKNRAARYGLPKDSCLAVGCGREEEESIYIRDRTPFIEHTINDFPLEIERLNRPWKPQYHSSG